MILRSWFYGQSADFNCHVAVAATPLEKDRMEERSCITGCLSETCARSFAKGPSAGHIAARQSVSGRMKVYRPGSNQSVPPGRLMI